MLKSTDLFEPKLPPINLLAVAPAWVFHLKRDRSLKNSEDAPSVYIGLSKSGEYVLTIDHEESSSNRCPWYIMSIASYMAKDYNTEVTISAEAVGAISRLAVESID